MVRQPAPQDPQHASITRMELAGALLLTGLAAGILVEVLSGTRDLILLYVLDGEGHPPPEVGRFELVWGSDRDAKGKADTVD